jgi:hypothetical protein
MTIKQKPKNLNSIMEHLEFVEILKDLGIRSMKKEKEVKKFEIDCGFGQFNTVLAENFSLKWENYSSESPLRALLIKAIDMGSWKHSWHNEIKPENYEKLKGIIQDRIIERAKEIDELLSIYFQLQHEIVTNA